MPKSQRRRTSWFITLPVAAGAIGYLWLVFVPTAKTIRETRSEIRQKQDFITSAAILPAAMSQAQRDLEFVEEFTHHWQQESPTPQQLSKLFGQINDRVRIAGATTTHFEPQSEVALKSLSHIPARLEVSGTFVQVGRLLAALESMPETIWVDDLELKQTSEDGQAVECALKLEIFAVNSKKSD